MHERQLGSEVDAAEAADLTHPALGEAVGGLGGGDLVGLSQLEDPAAYVQRVNRLLAA